MAEGQDGRQVRWDKHNQERRLQILDAAVAVIEDGAPGEEFHVRQIAQRAGLNRTVVYRHFTDRAELDTALRAHILDRLTDLMTPAVSLDGSINQVIHRIISTYVDWSVAHPALHAFAVQEGAATLERGIDRIATMLTEMLELVITLLGAELDEHEHALLDPLAHGLVGAVLGSVRRWLSREERVPPAPRLAQLLSMSVWNLLDGHARRLGVAVDPDEPLSSLLHLPETEGTAG